MKDATLLTVDASIDSMTPAQYAADYAVLRNHAGSLDKFVALTGSAYSKATWNKWERGESPLTRQMRNDIRRGMCVPELPMTVTEATGKASPDAAVWLVGSGSVDTIVMVGEGEYDLHVNGAVTVAQLTAQESQPSSVVAPTRNVNTICVSRATVAQNARREALKVTWVEVYESGLKALEMGGI
jgi:hypothetical protein